MSSAALGRSSSAPVASGSGCRPSTLYVFSFFEASIILFTCSDSASKIVSNATGFPVQFNKAIVGKNAFAHESGIHQDGMLKNRETYEIMTPESVGVKKTSLVMGKHSGRHAFKDKLSDLGYTDLTDDVIQNAFGKFKILADKKKHVYDEDILALVDDSLIVDNKINENNGYLFN